MAFRLTDADDYSRMAELDAMKLRWREKNRPAKRKPKPRGREVQLLTHAPVNTYLRRGSVRVVLTCKV